MKQTEIEQLLPVIFQRTVRPGTPLFALLEVMEALHAPSEELLQRLDALVDPYRTSDAFVAFLAGWVNLDRLFDESSSTKASPPLFRPPISTGLGCLRELLAAAAYLSQWRGTARGLILFLETATGMRGFEISEQIAGPDGRPQPFHIRIRAPEAVILHRGLIERIIESEKPAYVTYELEFKPSKQGDA